MSPSSPRCAARCAISGQRLPVAPLSDAGLTRKTVSLMTGVAVARATRVIRSTAAFISSSVIRLNSPSTTMSLTVEQAAGLHAAERADGEERGGLHLDGEHTALRPALVLALVRVVEEVARDDRADVHLLAHLLRRRGRRRGSAPSSRSGSAARWRRGASRSSRRVPRRARRSGRRARGAAAGRRTCRPAAASCTPIWMSSSKTIVAPGQPMPVPCTETGLPSHVPV